MKNWIVPEFQRSLTKNPAEDILVECDFSGKILPYFGRLVSATFTAVKWDISTPDVKVDGSDIFEVDGTAIITAPYLTHATVKVHAGDVDHDYHLTCLGVDDQDEDIVQDFYIRVRQ